MAAAQGISISAPPVQPVPNPTAAALQAALAITQQLQPKIDEEAIQRSE